MRRVYLTAMEWEEQDARCYRPGLISRTVLLMALLLTILPASHLFGSDLETRIQSASTLQTFDTHGGLIKSMRVASTSVAIRSVRNDSTIVTVYNTSGSQLFTRSLPNSDHPPIADITMSADGRTLLIMEEEDQEWDWKQVVYGIDGVFRFELSLDAQLVPSPTGRYFGISYNDIMRPRFAVYDSSGVQLPLSIPGLYEWRCRFVGDETFVVANRDSVWFVDITQSVVTSSHPLGREIFESPPIIKTSSEGGVVAIYNYDHLMTFTDGGQLLWSDSFGDCLGGVTIDDKGEWLALQFYHRGDHDGHLTIVPVQSPQERTVSGAIPELNNCIFRNDDVSWFHDGLVTLLLPLTAELGSLYDDIEYRTLMFSFDRESRLLGAPITVSGLFHPTGAPDQAANRFLRYDSNNTLTITEMPEADNQR